MARKRRKPAELSGVRHPLRTAHPSLDSRNSNRFAIIRRRQSRPGWPKAPHISSLAQEHDVFRLKQTFVVITTPSAARGS